MAHHAMKPPYFLSVSPTPGRMTREDSLARLYAPAMLFERLSMTLGNIPQDGDENDVEINHIHPQSAVIVHNQESTPRHSVMELDSGTNSISRNFGLNHNYSVRRKPVSQNITTPSTADLVVRDPVLSALKNAEATALHHAGNAAQAKRKKRRVSVAFSEIFANLSDKKGGNDGGEDEEGTGADKKPRRIKRMKTRISSWFVSGKKEH